MCHVSDTNIPVFLHTYMHFVSTEFCANRQRPRTCMRNLAHMYGRNNREREHATGTCFSHAHKQFHAYADAYMSCHTWLRKCMCCAPTYMCLRRRTCAPAHMHTCSMFMLIRNIVALAHAFVQGSKHIVAQVHMSMLTHSWPRAHACACERTPVCVHTYMHAGRAHIHASAFVVARRYPCVCTDKCMVVHSHTRVLHQHKRVPAAMRTCSCAHNPCISNKGQGVHMHQCAHGACL